MAEIRPERTHVLTIDIRPRPREAIKPAELIQVTGHQDLTLNARRAITILWHNAHAQGVTEGRDYTIEIDDLKPDGHKGYEMVEEAIEALMLQESKFQLSTAILTILTDRPACLPIASTSA